MAHCVLIVSEQQQQSLSKNNKVVFISLHFCEVCLLWNFCCFYAVCYVALF